ncbi:glycosyltransferase, partial [Candidatus Bathyarchaeota archaeon]|nr:glycosyltransferase [Candidatus Bathyarchaeota archaeon]
RERGGHAISYYQFNLEQHTYSLNGENKSQVAVILPTLNEAEGLAATVMDIKQHLDDPYILVVDGNSTDETVQVAKALGLDVIFQDGVGKGNAIAKAIKSLKRNPEYVVFIDADYTYPAEYIPIMIRILDTQPDVGMVCGNRFKKKISLSSLPNLFYFGNRLLAFTHKLINGVGMQDPLTGLRAIRWKIIRGWQPKSEGFDVEAEMNYYVEKQGYRIVEIPIHYRRRLGEKKLKLRHGLTILRRMLTEALLL